MIDKIVNILSNPNLVSLAQNTKSAVTIETGLKAVGRPSFTLIDKNTDKETRKYSAAKEFLYQGLCLGIYLTLVMPFFKNGALKLAQKMFKSEPVFHKFKNTKEFLEFHKVFTTPKANRLQDEVTKFTKNSELKNYLDVYDSASKNLSNEAKNAKDDINITKGFVEISSIVGSVLGLTIIAPELSHLILHPIMKGLGIEKNKDKKVTPSK